ncbi:MAG: YcxB family protein [Oscillospiraceae bacterium]|nr:YcxB family protein [Oscillospiraceae bacterium]
MFVFTLGITKQDYLQFIKLHKKLRYKLLYTILNILLGVIIAALSVMAVLFCVEGLWTTSLIRSYLLFAAALVFWFLINRLTVGLNYKHIYPFGQNVICFEDDGITEKADKAETRMQYDAIREICHYRDAWYLYVDKNHAVLLPGHCLTNGDAASFGAFLSGKTGMEIKEIK